MDKLEFYDELKSLLSREARKGNFRNDINHRGNLAYFCEIYQGNYLAFLDLARMWTINDFCWQIYTRIHATYIQSLQTDIEKEIYAVEYSVRELSYDLLCLKTFACVPGTDFPLWFFIRENMGIPKKSIIEHEVEKTFGDLRTLTSEEIENRKQTLSTISRPTGRKFGDFVDKKFKG